MKMKFLFGLMLCCSVWAVRAFDFVDDSAGDVVINWHIITPTQINNFFKHHNIDVTIPDVYKSGVEKEESLQAFKNKINQTFQALEEEFGAKNDLATNDDFLKKFVYNIFPETLPSDEEQGWSSSLIQELRGYQNIPEKDIYSLQDIRDGKRIFAVIKNFLVWAFNNKIEKEIRDLKFYIIVKYDKTAHEIIFFARSILSQEEDIFSSNQGLPWRPYCIIM